MSQLSQDEGLRTRVRTLLYRYAEAYLTCDHRQWTEKAVAELLLDCLREVPVVDPNSLWIPPEPFDALQQLYSLSRLSPYEEHFQTSVSALIYLKDVSKSVQGETRSERAALVDDPNLQKSQRLEEAALTTRAIRNTPKVTSGSASTILQKGPFHLLKGTKLVKNEDLDQGPLQNDSILNVNWQTSMGECRQEVREMLKKMLDLSGRVPLQAKIDHLDEFDVRTYRPDSPFIPIFPRKSLSAHKRGGADVGNEITSFAKLSAYLPPQISTEELEKDLFNSDMRVIDDWGAFSISSPSTLSTPTSSQLDRKIDKLFNGSSPTTDPYPTETLESGKMDIVQIPRLRRPGSGTEWKSITGDHCFTSFVLETLHGAKEPMASRLETPNCLEERASSIVGEAPCSETKVASIAVDEVDTDEEISKLYANESVKEFWSRDALDERDTMLMEVPNLPPPNIHRPGNIFLSSKFSDFCLVSANTAALPHLNTATLPQFLKKVKGLQPLNVVLSWKAFSTKEPLPCHAELVGVSSSFRISETSGVSVQAVKGLIEAVRVTKSDVEIGPRTSRLFEHEVLHRSTMCGADMILTRRERWRRAKAGLAGGKEEQIEIGSENPTTFLPEITFSPEFSPANDSTKLGINGVCIQHMTTSSELEEGGGTTLQLLPLEEVARRLWNNVKGTDLKNSYQIPVPTGGANWHETRIIGFAKLRSKTLLGFNAVPKVKPIQISDVPTEKLDESSGRPRHIPSDIYTPTTLQLPSQVKQPSAVHYYMASLDVLQKQVLVRKLREPSCFVELIERDNLGGADLIVDSFTAILYRSLFSLSSECDELIGLVSKLSWSFGRLVVVLEAFSPAHAMRSTDQADDLYAYTPPILKAIKRFRRGIDMVEADQEKRKETIVLFAFPNSVQEAAVITRYIGDMVQSLDQTEGVLWGDRSWLDHIDEDEENLATASGMNRFTSAIVLSQMTLDDFITMSPDDRHHAFSTLVGAYAIASFNADLENRISRSSSDIHHGYVRDPH